MESVLEAREKRIHKHKHGPPSAARRSFPFVAFELALSTWTNETILRKTSDHLDLQDPDALNPLLSERNLEESGINTEVPREEECGWETARGLQQLGDHPLTGSLEDYGRGGRSLPCRLYWHLAAAVMEATLGGKRRMRLWEQHQAPHKKSRKHVREKLDVTKEAAIMGGGGRIPPNTEGNLSGAQLQIVMTKIESGTRGVM